MPDHGSVWDSGPQYPDIWPDPSGEPAPAPAPDSADHTPPALSPVDLDAPARHVQATPAPTPQQGSRQAWWRGPFLGLATWIWLVALGVLLAVVAIIATSSGGSDPELVGANPGATVPTSIAVPVASLVPPPTLPEVTLPVTLPPLTAPLTAPATAAPASPSTAPVPPTTAPVVIPETAPVTAPPATLPPSPADGPIVVITGSLGPCRFGNECLIAGFTLEGFDSPPTQFVCEFGDGSRYTFNFDSGGVERACATGDTADSITIEVDGVRSETYRRP